LIDGLRRAKQRSEPTSETASGFIAILKSLPNNKMKRWSPNEPTTPGRYLVAMVNNRNKMRFIQPETLAENGHWCLETRNGLEMPAYGGHLERVAWQAFPDFPKGLSSGFLLYTPQQLPTFDPEADI
jgi:hypothetical protein